jgi:thioesterase III
MPKSQLFDTVSLMSPQWIAHIYPFQTKESQIDFLGHLNNLAYLEIFEEARWQMITERGFGYPKIQELQLGPVILGIEIQFRKEILLRQKCVVESKVQQYDGKIGKLSQEMKSNTGELLCRALYTIGLFDMRARKLVSPNSEWLHACGATPGSP